MQELRAGDAVRSIDGSGQTFFDEVYFFGHADASTSAEFVELTLNGNLVSLQLSGKHFVPTCPKNRVPCDWSEHTNVYAEDVQVGDYLWAMRGEQLDLQEVSATSISSRDGLYNPYTLSGRVVVNGVLASAHSEWVLDKWIPASLTRYLPAVYQVVFLPGRCLYHLVGVTAADALDVNNPQTAPEKHGAGPEFLAVVAMAAITATLFSFKRMY
jgi:desert hedgehog protein